MRPNLSEVTAMAQFAVEVTQASELIGDMYKGSYVSRWVEGG